jgi:hypothetical protein
MFQPDEFSISELAEPVRYVFGHDVGVYIYFVHGRKIRRPDSIAKPQS